MAVMVRCYLLCLLTLALCCACGLVWADSPKASDALIKPSTVGVPPLVRRSIPSSGVPGEAKEGDDMQDVQKEELMENPEEQEDEVEENVRETLGPGAGGSCPSGSDSSNCPSGHFFGGHSSSSDSLSENGVRGAGTAPIVQPQQPPSPPTLPLQQSAPGATCTPTSPDHPCTTATKELTPTKPVIPTPEEAGHGALVDVPSNKDGHRAADRTGAHVTLGDAAPGIGSGSGTDDTSSSSNHSTASPPPAASAPASDPQPGNSDNHASTAADNQGSAGTQPSSSITSSSETVSSGSSEGTTAGNGTTSAVSGSTSTQERNVGNTDTTNTTTTTTTTTTTLPPELTNNKKGDADSSSSISSSVWVRVSLLIVVTLACILVC
ncbi:uncharacterized protein TM35_000961050 [Trypanosoma theileri]|uniref:Mucin TcMUCII n=1 Tax=Trypanosoma theileri TaxID=67003 RepID=A0A1X0NF47_9TRYP|nr:uncharacterized protein TM35_000961050 [Trypanosoma theileri]ORC82226.1 hypothetical protein TM35_000961050 [Trypanosoma theileri]